MGIGVTDWVGLVLKILVGIILWFQYFHSNNVTMPSWRLLEDKYCGARTKHVHGNQRSTCTYGLEVGPDGELLPPARAFPDYHQPTFGGGG